MQNVINHFFILSNMTKLTLYFVCDVQDKTYVHAVIVQKISLHFISDNVTLDGVCFTFIFVR